MRRGGGPLFCERTSGREQRRCWLCGPATLEAASSSAAPFAPLLIARKQEDCSTTCSWSEEELTLVPIPQILSCGDSENFGQAAEAKSGCGGMEARRRVGKARAAPRAVTRSTSAGPGLYSRPARHTHGAPARAPSAPAPTVVPSARSPASARHGRGRCGKGRAPSPRAVAARLAPI